MNSEEEVVRVEHTYTTQQLADVLQIGRSTLNKYSRAMEEHGYTFIKGENEKRAYTEHDIVALRQLLAYLERNMAYDSAIKSVSTQYKRTGSTRIVIPATQEIAVPEALDGHYKVLEEKIDKQSEQIEQLVELNRALFIRMDEQQAYIEKSIGARDAQLMAALREMQETKQLQLAAAEEAKQKQPFWKRVFGG